MAVTSPAESIELFVCRLLKAAQSSGPEFAEVAQGLEELQRIPLEPTRVEVAIVKYLAGAIDAVAVADCPVRKMARIRQVALNVLAIEGAFRDQKTE